MSDTSSKEGEGQKTTKVQQIGRYKLLERLGAGGMGAVYKAVDTQMNRTVALKVLSSRLVSNPKYVERFMREARSAAALNHPHIVRAEDVGQEGSLFYFAMEFVEGSTLRQLLKKRATFTETEALDVALQTAGALQHATSRSIVHRDIKPDNIMMTPDGQVKLTDLGLAKAVDGGEATITQAGVMIGTPHYASPEQIRGEPDIDFRTDIYSLGMTLYHLVVGNPPFDGPSAGVITLKHLNDPLPDPRTARPDLSEGFGKVLKKMTEKRRDDRYTSVDHLIEDLEQVRQGQPPPHAAPPPPLILRKLTSSRAQAREKEPAAAGPTRSGGAGILVVGLAALAVAAFVVFSMLKGKPSKQEMTAPSTVSSTSSVTSTTVQPEPKLSGGPPPAGKGASPETKTQEATKQAARRVLQEARDFAEKQPDDVAGALSFYSKVLGYSGLPEADQAQEQIRLLRQRVDEAFQQTEGNVRGHLEARRYGDAATALASFPESYRVQPWNERFGALADNVDGQTQEAYETLKRQGEGKLQERQFAAAREVYQAALPAFPPRFKEQLEADLAEIADRERLERESLQRKKYQDFLREAAPKLKERKYEEVVVLAEKGLQDPECPRLEFEMEAEHARLLVRLLELVESGAKARKGKSFRHRGAAGVIDSVEKGRMELKMGADGPSIKIAIRKDLDTAQVMELTESFTSSDPDGLVMVGAFYFADGRFKEAEASWQAAAKAGKNVELALKKVALAGRGAAEIEAQNALEAVRSLAQRKRWQEAVKAIEKARADYAQTEAIGQAQAELDRLLDQAGQQLARTDDEVTASGAPRREIRDGFEQFFEWKYLDWKDTGSGSGTVIFETLGETAGKNQVIRFRYQNVKKVHAKHPPKIFFGREARMDLVRAKELFVRVYNPSDNRLKINLALLIGDEMTYYESPFEFEVPAKAWKKHEYSLTRPQYSCAATNWANTGAIKRLDDVRLLVFVIHPSSPDGEVILETIDASREP
ncbi:MAG: serine/threonine protein kinase [Planctomycetes bacterium]|nr:serine/threonine protein kinase [Planctomycetota bacterium]